MRRRLITLVLFVLLVSYIPTNNLNSDNNIFQDSNQYLTQNDGNSEMNPKVFSGDSIELAVNFSATQRQFWFELSSLGPSTWINQTISVDGNNWIGQVIYRAHTSFDQCLSGTHYFDQWWNSVRTSNSLCNNPSEDSTILMVLYLEESNFLYNNGSINYDVQLPMIINLTVAQHQSIAEKARY